MTIKLNVADLDINNFVKLCLLKIYAEVVSTPGNFLYCSLITSKISTIKIKAAGPRFPAVLFDTAQSAIMAH